MSAARNHWATYKSSLVLWYVSFPAETWSRPDVLFGFVEAVCAAGEHEEVYSIRETRQPDAFDRGRGGSWPAHVRRLWRDDRGRTLFPYGGPVATADGRLRIAARLSAFTEPSGEIADHEVVDVGELLVSLRPELAARRVPRVGAIEVAGPMTVHPSWPVDITVTASTDIWLPWVVGHLEDDDADRFYDNRALAARHTPRLNRFLQAVREEAVDRGAEWGFDPDAGANVRYRLMVDESGVRLSDPPPTW
jgi:hypothetical protein